MKSIKKVLYIIALGVLIWSACEPDTYRQGSRIYAYYCANCHMEDGKGLQGIIPPLAGADYLSGSRSELACIIRYGQKGEIVVNGKSYNQIMTGIPELNEVEIANVLNYVFNEWGNKEPFISPDEVKIQLENCEGEEM